MKTRHVARWGSAATAMLAVAALSACQPETVSSGETAPATTASAAPTSAADAPSTTTSAAPSTPASGESDPSHAPWGPDGGIPNDHSAPRGVFSVDGGYLVDGSKVTFVYNNGVRQTIDVGQPIPDPTDAVVKTSLGTLTLTPDQATWRTDDGASVVDSHGAGTIVTNGGMILVLANGTATCANGSGLQFVGSGGNKASASKGGVFYVDESGKKTTFDKPSSGGSTAGQFTVCGIGDQVSMDLFSDVLFDFDKADLTAAGKAVVASAAATIKDDARGKTVHVTGHTDSKGTPAANVKLGMARAKAVAAVLKKQIPGVTVKVTSAGQTQPIAANTTPQGDDLPDGRAKNRRVSITYTR